MAKYPDLKSYLQTNYKDLLTSEVQKFVDGNYEFYEVDDDGVTSIDKVENSSRIDGSFDIYDLQGRRVEKPGKGIYIINGKKVIFD